MNNFFYKTIMADKLCGGSVVGDSPAVVAIVIEMVIADKVAA